MMRILCVAVLAWSLTGCASRTTSSPYYQATPEDLAQGNYGTPPEDPMPAILAHMQRALKDPESARYRCEPAKKAHRVAGATRDGLSFFYRVDCKVNAKNAYGGYVGEHDWEFTFRDGVLTDGTDMTQLRIDTARIINRRY